MNESLINIIHVEELENLQVYAEITNGYGFYVNSLMRRYRTGDIALINCLNGVARSSFGNLNAPFLGIDVAYTSGGISTTSVFEFLETAVVSEEGLIVPTNNSTRISKPKPFNHIITFRETGNTRLPIAFAAELKSLALNNGLNSLPNVKLTIIDSPEFIDVQMTNFLQQYFISYATHDESGPYLADDDLTLILREFKREFEPIMLKLPRTE